MARCAGTFTENPLSVGASRRAHSNNLTIAQEYH
jgi:hypothetical protein